MKRTGGKQNQFGDLLHLLDLDLKGSPAAPAVMEGTVAAF